MTINLTERIATLESRLRDEIDRHNQARAALNEAQTAIHQLEGALALARELHAANSDHAPESPKA